MKLTLKQETLRNMNEGRRYASGLPPSAQQEITCCVGCTGICGTNPTFTVQTPATGIAQP